MGSPIIASADGVVTIAIYSTEFAGNWVEVQHEDEDKKKWLTRYMHVSQLNVIRGQEVRQGDVIGAVGNSERSIDPHLHFEILFNGSKPADPLEYIFQN